MIAANRLYALDLLNRAGTAYDVRDISVVASIIPLLERDVIATIAAPVDGVFFTAQAICRARIAEGRHRPGADPEPPAERLQSSQPGQPAAARASNPAGGSGVFGEQL